MASQPNVRIFPLAGWRGLPRMLKLGDPTKFCAEISFWDDYMAPRGDTFHYANDIVAPIMTPVLAVTDGVAWPNLELGDHIDRFVHFKNGGWHCYIKGDDGFIYYYAHLHKSPFIRPGQRVRAGQLIGYVGRSGNPRGCPHLHFAIFRVNRWGGKGATLNPRPFLLATFPRAREVWKPVAIGVGAFTAGGLLAFWIWRWRKRRHEGT